MKRIILSLVAVLGLAIAAQPAAAQCGDCFEVYQNGVLVGAQCHYSSSGAGECWEMNEPEWGILGCGVTDGCVEGEQLELFASLEAEEGYDLVYSPIGTAQAIVLACDEKTIAQRLALAAVVALL